jgi:hypothetical protein
MRKFWTLVILLVGITYSGALLAGNGDTKEKQATSEVSISGTITDGSTGESLAGVSVSLVGSDKSVYTDFDGRFKFTGLKPGEYTLKTIFISYHESSSKVQAKADEQNEVLLKLTSLAF